MYLVYFRPDLRDYGVKLAEELGARILGREEDVDDAEVTVVVGGDGTLLYVIQSFPEVLRSVIFHVGAGRVNFYRTVLVDAAGPREVARLVLEKRYMVRELPMLDAGMCRALNDVVVRGTNVAKLVGVRLTDGYLDLDVRADGVVVSTVHGAAGYAFSLGAPIVDDRLNAKVIAFIAPFSLYVRPIVHPWDRKVRVELAEDGYAICDGQVRGTTRDITVGPSSAVARIATLNTNFYERVKERVKSQ